MSQFKVEVMGGLCSRLRAVVGAMALCDQKGHQLIVNWPSRERIYKQFGGFQARLRDLWKYDESVVENDVIERLPKSLPGNAIRTCHIEDFWRYFTPEKDPAWHMRKFPLSDKVRGYYDPLAYALEGGSNVVGLHVRNWLKQPGTVGVDWFIEKIREFPDDQKFFLSCDSKEVSDRIHAERVGCVYEIPKNYDYDKAGIQKSMADLYLLADKCAWVIGSNYSSYSQMACLMRGGRYLGPHDKPHGLSGGFYEDAWNGHNEQEFMEAMGRSTSDVSREDLGNPQQGSSGWN